MRLIDEKYTQRPFYEAPKMTQWLKREGYCVNHKRISRLMKLMGFEAMYPKRIRVLSLRAMILPGFLSQWESG